MGESRPTAARLMIENELIGIEQRPEEVSECRFRFRRLLQTAANRMRFVWRRRAAQTTDIESIRHHHRIALLLKQLGYRAPCGDPARRRVAIEQMQRLREGRRSRHFAGANGLTGRASECRQKV